MTDPHLDITQLSPDERLALIERLWDSLEESDVPLTPLQSQELDRREARHRGDPGRGRPWREIFDEIGRGNA